MQFLTLCVLLVSLFAASSATDYCRCIPRPARNLRGGEQAVPERKLTYEYTAVCATNEYCGSTMYVYLHYICTCTKTC
jgi:hypothetical protein